MDLLKEIANITGFINRHPLTAGKKSAAYLRFLRWQIGSRLAGMPLVMPFIGNTRLVIDRGMTGATGNVYVGLHEFNDMSLVLHLLREKDLFGDIGANVGVYTVLASGVCRSRTIAVEPLPSTFERLLDNLNINNLGALVSAYCVGLSSERGHLTFTDNLDTMNHVVWSSDASGTKIQVDTVDNIFSAEVPLLLKLDVEGYEAPVLMGAQQTLSNPALKGLIVELNGSGKRYGFDDTKTHANILSYGFAPFRYLPHERQLYPLKNIGSPETQNVLYIRDLDFVFNRLLSAPGFSVLGRRV